MEKPSQTLFGSISNDSGWHVAIYAVWRLRLGTGRGGLHAVLAPVWLRQVTVPADYALCRSQSASAGSMDFRRSISTPGRRWAGGARGKEPSRRVRFRVFGCDRAGTHPAYALQDTDHPSWTPATIFLATDHLHHLLVKNGMRRDKNPGGAGWKRGVCCEGDGARG